MASIRTLAANELETLISNLDSSWTVGVLQGGYSNRFEAPCINISPMGRFTFKYFNEEEVWTNPQINSDQHVLELGVMEGSYRILVTASSPAQREDIEQQIIDLFHQIEMAPGMVRTTIDDVPATGIGTTYDAIVVFDLASSEWEEDEAGQDTRKSSIIVDTNIPILVSRDNPFIDQLVVYMTDDFDEDDPDVLETISEKFGISEDGDVIPWEGVNMPVLAANAIYDQLTRSSGPAAADDENMAVDASVTPSVYRYTCPTNKIALLGSLNVVINDGTGSWTGITFGQLAALTVGVKVQVIDTDGSTVLLDLIPDGETAIKTNGDWGLISGHGGFSIDSALGYLRAHIHFTESLGGEPLRLNAGQHLQITINDDISGLISMRAHAQGELQNA